MGVPGVWAEQCPRRRQDVGERRYLLQSPDDRLGRLEVSEPGLNAILEFLYRLLRVALTARIVDSETIVGSWTRTGDAVIGPSVAQLATDFGLLEVRHVA